MKRITAYIIAAVFLRCAAVILGAVTIVEIWRADFTSASIYGLLAVSAYWGWIAMRPRGQAYIDAMREGLRRR
jgi:hypothetical protein